MSREHAEFIQQARQMYADARQRYQEMAEPYLLDHALRDFSAALVKAIGEVSPEEAIAALRKMAVERGHKVV